MWQTGCWSLQLLPIPVKFIAVSPSEAVISVRWEQWAVTETSAGFSELEGKQFSQTVKVCCRTLKNLVFLTFGKEMFWFLTNSSLCIWGLHGHCSDREHGPFSHQSPCAAYPCNSRQQRWDSRLLWGVLSSHPQGLNTQFSSNMIFPTSTPVPGTNPGKLKTLPHDTHSALQYLFPNPSDKCSCYSVLILSQTHQHALKWDSKGELKPSIYLQAIFQ